MSQQQHQPRLTWRDQAHFHAFNSRAYMTEPNYDNARDGIFEMEAPNDMNIQHDRLLTRIEDMIMNSFESTRQRCAVCRGGHHATDCPLVNQVDGATFDPYHPYNPCPVGSTSSNSYNPARQSPQDYPWSNYHQPISNMCQSPQFPEFQNDSFQPVHDQQIPQYQQSYMEELLENYIMESQRQDEFQPVLNQPIQIPQKSRLEDLLENFLLEHQKHEEVMEQQMRRLANDMEQLQASNAMLEHQIAQRVASYEEVPSQPRPILEEEAQLFALPWRYGEQLEAPIMEPALEQDEGENMSPQMKEGEVNLPPMQSDQDDSCLETDVDAQVIREELHGNQFSNVEEGYKADGDSYQQEEPQNPMLLDTTPTLLLPHVHKSEIHKKSSLSKGRASQVKSKPLYSQFQKFCALPGLVKNTTTWALKFCKPDLKAAADKRHLRLNE